MKSWSLISLIFIYTTLYYPHRVTHSNITPTVDTPQLYHIAIETIAKHSHRTAIHSYSQSLSSYQLAASLSCLCRAVILMSFSLCFLSNEGSFSYTFLNCDSFCPIIFSFETEAPLCSIAIASRWGLSFA
jgi:hypothetical protein